MKKIICLTLSILIFILTLSGCVEKKGKDVYTRNYMIYNVERFPQDLGIIKNDNLGESTMITALFQGLVKQDDSGKIKPAIAQSFNQSNDKLEYDFVLRDDAKWSDGSKITANDFVAFFQGLLDSPQKKFYGEELDSIYGVRDYVAQKCTFDKVGIRAVNGSVLQMRMNYLCDYLPSILSSASFALRKIDDTSKNWKEGYGKIKYTGPYVIDKVNEDSEVILGKNTNYWDSANVKSESVMLTSLESNEIALANFETNNIDITVDPPVSETRGLLNKSKATTVKIPSEVVVNFNFKKKSQVSDVNFRKKIESGINRLDITDAVLDGTEKPAESFVPWCVGTTNNEYYPEIPTFKTTCDKGNTSSSNYNPVTLIYLDNDKNKKVSEAIAKSLKENSGIIVNTKGYDKSSLSDAVDKGDYDMLLTEQYERFNDPLCFFMNYMADSEFNISGYRNQNYENCIRKAIFQTDAAKRKQIYNECEKILYNDMAAVPIYYDTEIVCKQSQIRGLAFDRNGNIIFDNCYISSEKKCV